MKSKTLRRIKRQASQQNFSLQEIALTLHKVVNAVVFVTDLLKKRFPEDFPKPPIANTNEPKGEEHGTKAE